MSSFEIPVRGPYSLAASADFLMSFTPAAGSAACPAGAGSIQNGGCLSIAFRLDGSFAPVAVSLTQMGDKVHGLLHGSTETSVARRQVARILSLDHDGDAWTEVGVRDPVIGALQARYNGLRPVCFASPYEAAVWGLLAHRLRMTQAAPIKRRLAEQHGDTVTVDGLAIPIIPSPRDLLKLESFPGITDEKMLRLHGIAEAALDGRLDADRLRGRPVAEALAGLSALRGVGPWTAGHILLRGAGTADAPAFTEPRVARGLALAYRLRGTPTDEECLRIAESWRPFRTWVAVLLAVHLSRTGDWSSPLDRSRRGRPRKKWGHDPYP